ncbi:M2 family metallopeptidase [Aestuariispira insulae]|uniref:Peptidyl-dipeptidase A n=1 Tax=Aestuariispira insulae TaxID=1461337 RepID=A0A3D9HHB8_9PROT|nr:M2 family metallopeptidase [Aestuariispira insulae]RED48651.1 peptidyl-dipeptidase A [Aestuariispira insulae]
MRFKSRQLAHAAVLALLVPACALAASPSKTPTAEEAAAFIRQVEETLDEKSQASTLAAWTLATDITPENREKSIKADAEYSRILVDLIEQSKQYQGLDLDPVTARKMGLLKRMQAIPKPSDHDKLAELARLEATLAETYSLGEFCLKNGDCFDGTGVIGRMAKSRDEAELKALWAGWREIAPPMKKNYARLVSLSNEGARELGFANTGELWRSGYDMPAKDFPAEAERLWQQVRPLYDALHCHTKAKLTDYYGQDVMPKDGTIPAHLLGNVWAQQWGNIYDIVATGDSGPGYDLTLLLEQENYNARKMMQAGEDFFDSIGMGTLPASFWQKSLLEKPNDRKVACHASAWDITRDDVRIKMCTSVNAEDFQTVHHELGHIYTYMAYKDQSHLFRDTAHDGFHEAIGDAIGLSVTPNYLRQIRLLKAAPEKTDQVDFLLNQALDKVAFLPFGLLVDQWRWKVFSGEVKPENYNQTWWELRRQYQGISAPMTRGENAFDPGAKYHIPNNTPYMRYFLAHIMQFQLFEKACTLAGQGGDLTQCSLFGNKEVGRQLTAMLEMGASKPWPDALEKFTGSRQMDAGPMLAYFKPLKSWLDEQNKGRSCGWR